MKAIWSTSLLCALCMVVSSAVAQHGVGLFIAGQDAHDGETGSGLVLRYQFDSEPQANSLRAFAQVGSLTGFGSSYAETEGGMTFSAEVEADLIPIEVALAYDLALTERVLVYLGAGIGYYLVDVESSLMETMVIEGVPVTMDWSSVVQYTVDDGAGGFGMIGLEADATEWLRLVLEVRYTFLKLDDESVAMVPGEPVDRFEDEVDLSGLGISLGMLYEW